MSAGTSKHLDAIKTGDFPLYILTAKVQTSHPETEPQLTHCLCFIKKWFQGFTSLCMAQFPRLQHQSRSACPGVQLDTPWV